MKKLIFFLALLLIFPAAKAPAASPETIKVFCWSLTPQARAVLRGLERTLDRSLPVVEAGGNAAQGDILIRQLAAEELGLLVVLGTQALTLTAPKIKKTPVVFAMVADPYHSAAAYDKAHPEDHQDNITGIASPPPLEEAIRQSLALFPAKRHWALLYDPFEGPSVELKQNFASLARTAGLKLTARETSAADIEKAFNALHQQGVQVILILPDQFSRQYAQPLAALGQARRFVVINGNPGIESKGAVLSVTLNYEALGEQAAHLSQRILGGEKPKNIPIIQASPARVEVNDSLLNAWAGYPPGKR